MKRSQIVLSILIGICAGTMATAYRLLLGFVGGIREHFFASNDALNILAIVVIYLILTAIVELCLRWQPLSSGSGIPQIEAENMGLVKMNSWKVLVAKFVGGAATSLGGLSLGREGPSIQVGGATAKLITRIFHTNKEDTIALISAGASAGLSAAFGAPVSSTFFALEEMQKSFSAAIVVPTLIAAIIADFIAKYVIGVKPVFQFQFGEPLRLDQYWHILLLGAILAVGGIIFNRALIACIKFNKRWKAPTFIKRYIPFLLSIIIGYFTISLVGTSLQGGGQSVIELIDRYRIGWGILLILFAIKFAFTIISYGSGAPGGIFFPSLVLGSGMGLIYCMIMTKLGLLDIAFRSNFIVLGMVGFLSSVVRTPIMAIMLVVEMTGNVDNTLPLALVSISSCLAAELTKTKPVYDSLFELLQDDLEVRKKSGSKDEEKTMPLTMFAKQYSKHLQVREPLKPRKVNELGKVFYVSWELFIRNIKRRKKK